MLLPRKAIFAFLFLLPIISCLNGSIDTCSDNIDGSHEDNIVDVTTDIENETECLENCKNNPRCRFYTHFSAMDPIYPNYCFLLFDILDTIKTCEHCSTGPADCESSVCGFILSEGSYLMEYYKFNNNAAVHIVNLGKRCNHQFYIWGIGGGGAGGLYAGGGSGGPKDAYYSPDNSSDLVITVGGQGQDSTVINSAEEEVLKAYAGGGAWYQHGGNGYSGGAGGGEWISGGGSGGMDGGDGASWGREGVGGKGSGVDVLINDLKLFNLGSGTGGSGGGGCCGGGGGVKVDGEGPVGANNMVGTGYGGGGGSCNGENYSAQPGTVIIEFIES